MVINSILQRTISVYRDAYDTSRMATMHKKKYPNSKVTRDTFSRAIRNNQASSELISTLKAYYRLKINKLNQNNQ